MGVPKFFRYISERYPCLSEIVKEYQLPEFDNLYLDMNGIIHSCSHPDDNNPHFRITEEQIFKDIFHYIEVLFRMIRPRKLFFLAIDGVAPRAKMNQQRGRRFRSAKDAEMLIEKAKAKGEVLPTEARFDSNCITPGTLFMAKLHEQLKYFIVNKISTDKSWQKCKVILSGHETPGEGEHKIMDYIRYLRAQPGYNPHLRHCLYGLDADLIMLGLCTHEPHFSLLREEVKFDKKAKKTSVPEQITFFLLHLSLMREYLELEFISLKDKIPFEFDLEKIIDDWVLMGFLVGNDFIPHLPNLHIHQNALPIMYNVYMKVLPTLEGYINEDGKLNLERFGRFLNELSSIDTLAFQETYADLKYFEDKTGRKMDQFEKPKTLEAFFVSDDEAPNTETPVKNDLVDLIKSTDNMFLDSDDTGVSESENEDGGFFESEFKQHKNDYYINKLDYSNVTPDVLKSQAEGYVRAIQWNLHYYYNGCCSWSWYYPHHYAPYISDIKEFSNLDLHYDLGKPFLPFQQLLAVLPSASKKLLPDAYQPLMVNDSSPIIKYYPTDFQTDLNGKRQEWEAVVVIPFIEEKDLLDAMIPCDEKLTVDEQRRNSHGPMLVYEYTVENQGTYEAPEYFPRINNNHATLQRLTVNDIRVPPNKLIKGRYPGANFDTYYPGFPSFKHLKYVPTLDKLGVKVFDQPSRGDNLIINIQSDTPPAIEELAEKLLGQTIYVEWPHLSEAKVITVSNNKVRYELSNSAVSDEKYHMVENKGDLLSVWKSSVRGVQERYLNRLGINVGNTEILVHVLQLTGRSYVFGLNNIFTLEKQWANVAATYPFQATVQDIQVKDPNYIQYKNVDEIYPLGGKCFMLGIPHYGSEGVIIGHNEVKQTGRIKVTITALPEPDFSHVRQLDEDLQVQYMTSYKAAQRLGINSNLFSRITGTVFIIPGERVSSLPDNVSKTNIGLNLKFNKRSEEIPGYTKKDGSMWLYSLKAVQLVREYMDFCPELFEYMAEHSGKDVFFETEVFPDEMGQEKIKEVAAWIKKQPYTSIEKQSWGSKLLDPEVVLQIEKTMDEHLASNKGRKAITMQVKPRLLFMPELNMGSLCPDSKATYHLYDRVVNIREYYTVPVGLRGTIIGIHEQPSINGGTHNQSNLLYDIVFDEEFTGGLILNCSPNRGYRTSAQSLINITHGIRMENLKTGNNSLNTDKKQQNINHWKKTPNPQSANSAFAIWNNNSSSSLDKRTSHQVLQNYPAPVNETEQKIMFPPLNLPTVNAPKQSEQAKVTAPKKSEQKPGLVEFQAIWNELHQLGKKDKTPQVSATKPNREISNTNQLSETKSPVVAKQVQKTINLQPSVSKSPMKLGTNSASKVEDADSSTELLKKMLKINDNESRGNDSSNNATKSLHSPAFAKQISVEELFQHAKASGEKKFMNQIPVKSYTLELLNRYQLLGLGLPRYTYLLEKSGTGIRAQLCLPNGKYLVGAPAPTREQASESAAYLALLDRSLAMEASNTYVNQPNSSLPTPPQQWFQRNMLANSNSSIPNPLNPDLQKKAESQTKTSSETINNIQKKKPKKWRIAANFSNAGNV